MYWPRRLLLQLAQNYLLGVLVIALCGHALGPIFAGKTRPLSAFCGPRKIVGVHCPSVLKKNMALSETRPSFRKTARVVQVQLLPLVALPAVLCTMFERRHIYLVLQRPVWL